KLKVIWQRRKAEFRYPIGPAPRTAVLVGWFRESGRVRVFRNGWCDAADRLAPNAIAATWPQFQGLMTPKLAAPDRRGIVLARPGQALLTAIDREELWRTFHVPVFEQFIGPGGQILAAECEAHDGLHVENESFALSGYTLTRELCACGRTTPRLIHIQPV